MLGRLLAGSGGFGDVTGLDVTLPGSGIRTRKLCTAATAGATLMCSREVAGSGRGRGTDYTFAESITGSSAESVIHETDGTGVGVVLNDLVHVNLRIES
jgi:hypothetical protein